MVFELEADGVRVWCSSPFWTQKLVAKGAKLVDSSQAAYLAEAVEASEPHAQSFRPERPLD